MSRVLFFVFLTAFHPSLASGDPIAGGARSWGLGNASVTVADRWSIFNNAAGMTGVERLTLVSAFTTHYAVPGLQTLSLGMVYPTTKYGNLGLGIQRFGDELYSEHIVGIAYSHVIHHVSLGAKVNYMQIAMGELRSRRAMTFEFGGIATLSSKLFFGAHIYNFNQARLAEYQDERIPTVMKAGLSYRPTKQLMINVEAEKDIDFPASFKAGMEYEIVKSLQLRTGMSTKPFAHYFGMGFSPKNFQFDYALSTHPQLGISHHLSLAYCFAKKEKK